MDVPAESNSNDHKDKELLDLDREIISTRLAKACRNIHATYLFHPKGAPVLKKLCSIMSSTIPDMTSVNIDSWKDLAACIGLTSHQIDCIENYTHGDCTEMVLRTYAQNRTSTLEILMLALGQLERDDLINQIKPYVEELIEFTKIHHFLPEEKAAAKRRHSLFLGSSSDKILRPGFVNYHLPVTLLEWMEAKFTPTEQNNAPEEDETNIVEKESPEESIVVKKVRKCSKKVMLTFAKDGEAVARKVAFEFRRPRKGNLPIGVLILNEHPNKIIKDPENFIIQSFEKVDFVVPIVSLGYLNALAKLPDVMTMESCIDPYYVPLINDLMRQHYYKNGEKNGKTYCIIPNDQVGAVLNHIQMRFDPTLREYFMQSQLERVIRTILNVEKNPV